MILLRLILPFIIYELALTMASLATPPTVSILLVNGLGALVAIPFLYALLRRDRIRAVAPVTERPVPAFFCGWLLLFGAAASVAANNLITLSGVARLFPAFDQEVVPLLYQPPLLTQVVCIGLLAPAAEELIFRGQVYSLLRAKMPWRAAMILSALLFALYHGNVVQGIYAFALGLFMAWLYEKSGSLAASWLFHAGANLCSVFLTFIGNHFPATLAFPIFLAQTGIAAGAVVWLWPAMKRRLEESE